MHLTLQLPTGPVGSPRCVAAAHGSYHFGDPRFTTLFERFSSRGRLLLSHVFGRRYQPSFPTCFFSGTPSWLSTFHFWSRLNFALFLYHCYFPMKGLCRFAAFISEI